jgi:RNA polymerase sigma-70 factor (ECF subfamily)
VTGDAAQFAAVLAADAVLYSDGGGKRTAALNPIFGRDKIVRFFEGLARGGNLPPAEAIHRIRLGGLPGVVVVDPNGAIDTIMTADVRDGQVVTIYAVRNPDKLAHLSLRSFRSAADTN